MATRGTALSRALNYFRTADVDEARVAFQLTKEIVERRIATSNQAPKEVVRRATRIRKVKPVDAAGSNTQETHANA